MSHHCPTCRTSLAPETPPEYCPVCTLQAALALEPVAPPLLHRIGDYELVEEIARGGSGVVFRAKQTTLGRPVAIKLLLAGQFAHPSARQRFQTEAMAAASLRHPNIVTVFDVGDYEGQPWLAMELMDGGTLADRVRDGPVSAREAAFIVAKLAHAVHTAHRAKILHRDLKPSNILLDAFGEPRIADFGLAKFLSTDNEITVSGQVLGSPSFMAPEQAAGRNENVDPRTDVYSLGAILYQLLTGRPPFQSDSASATLRLVETADPIAPKRLNPSIPADLETITLKCLEKAPARRYSSSEALADDLNRFLNGRSVQARPRGAVERAWCWSRRRKGLAAAWVLLVVIAIGSTAAALRIDRAEKRAVHRLIESLAAQSSAVRNSTQLDRRSASLRLVREAMFLRPNEAMRQVLQNEAIAALALPEAQVVLPSNFPASGDAMMLCVDPSFEFCTVLGSDDYLRVIRLRDGHLVHRLSVHVTMCDQVLALSDGARYLILRRGTLPILWDVERDALVLGVQGATGLGVFTPQGNRLARPEADGIALYSLPELKRDFIQIRNLPAPISRVAWLTDDSMIAGLSNGLIALCNLKTGELQWRHPYGEASALAVSSDGRLIAVGLVRGNIAILDVLSGEVLTEFKGSAEYIPALAFDQTSGLLAAADLAGSLRLLGLPEGEILLQQNLLTWSLAFSPDGRRLGPVRVGERFGWIEWSPSIVASTLRPARVSAQPRIACFSPDGRWLARATASEVLVWDTRSGRLMSRLPAAERITSLSFGSDSHDLWVSEATEFSRWELRETNGLLAPKKLSHPHSSETFDKFVFFRQGQWLVGTSLDERIRFGPLDSTSPLTEFGKGLVQAASPNGDLVLVAHYHKPTVRILNLREQTVPFELADQGAITGVFSPDGKWLATSGRQTQLWRIADWKLVAKFDGSPIVWPDQKPAFAPSGNWFAYLTKEGSIRIVSVPDGRPIADLEHPTQSPAYGLEFSPEGDRLAVVRNSGVTTIWNLSRLRQELQSLRLQIGSER